MAKQKLPYMQFYPGDYIRDTRGLSAEAKGVWMDALCFMWDAPERGILRNTPEGFARMFGTTVEAFDAVLMQFDVNIICDINRDENGIVTLMSRRIIRDEYDRDKERTGNRLRKQKQREKEAAKEESRECHANVGTHMSEVRSQKSEVREEKPPISPKGDELPSGFFRFWEIYPRKVAKAAALKSWKRLRCEPISEKIIASVLEHIDSDDWQKEGGAFVPHPTTYLNQGRWEDEVVSRQIEKKKARLHPALMA